MPSWSKVGPKGASWGHLGALWGHLGVTMGIFGALLASLFPGPFPRPVFGLVRDVGVLSGCCRAAVGVLSGCCRAVQGPAAVVLWVGGGFLRRSLYGTVGRELHTPSGQFRDWRGGS